MKKIIVYGIVFTGIVLSSCGGGGKSADTLAKDTLTAPQVETAPKVEVVQTRNCDCCGREFNKNNGWYNASGTCARVSNGKMCSQKCAKDCPPA